MEKHLAYIWKNRLFDVHSLITTAGEKVEVIDFGLENRAQGPDFFNSKVRIGDTMWAGTVEIHNRASDWHLHHHSEDPSYNSVILHVVGVSDADITDQNGRRIPQVVLSFPQRMLGEMDYLLSRDRLIACSQRINEVEPFRLNNWMSRLLTERLEQKTNQLILPLRAENLSWDECFYRIIARTFGFGSNADAFERIARSLPLNVILKHTDSITHVEALLFGQAGLLNDDRIKEKYPRKLQEEYRFLAHKYQLQAVSPLFNLRVNKGNLPAIRLAQLAQLLIQTPHLVAVVKETDDLNALKKQFKVTLHSFWNTHYSLYQLSEENSVKSIGERSLEGIIINAVIPLLFSMGDALGEEELQQRSFRFLELINAEDNSIIREWATTKVPLRNAFDSQALLQLHKCYCQPRKCFSCQIAYELLSKRYRVFCEEEKTYSN